MSHPPIPEEPSARALPTVITRYREPLLHATETATAQSPGPLDAMLRYHLGLPEVAGAPSAPTGGKTFRGALCLFTCESICGDWHPALPWAVALELVHNFSLVHDDIQDEDTERRHRATLWARWGKPRALWAGDVLHGRADTAPWAAGTWPRMQPRVEAAASVLLAEACLEMIQGQIRDIEFETCAMVEAAEYLKMIEGKTGALVRCAMEVGALAAGASETAQRDARQCGQALGRLFQVRDDILGIWGDTAATGKGAGNDIRRRKKTYPIVYAAQAAEDVRRTIMDAYGAPVRDDLTVGAVVAALQAVDARAQSQAVAEEAASRALDSFGRVVANPRHRNDMRQLTTFLLTRAF